MSNLGKLFGKFAVTLFVVSAVLFVGAGCKHESSPSPAPVVPGSNPPPAAKHTLTKIEVTRQPDNTGKFVGDALNTAGLEITAYYADDKNIQLTLPNSGISISPETLSSVSNTITVTYDDGTTTKTTTFTVTATAVVVDRLEIKQAPETIYSGENKTPALTNMKVEAVYNNGTRENVTEYTTKLTVKDSNTAITQFNETDSEYVLSVSAKGKSVEIPMIYTPTALTVSSIEVTTPPTKTEYMEGDALDLTGLVVTATMSNSLTTTPLITVDNITGVDMNNSGEQTATITYEGQTASFTINVAAKPTITDVTVDTEDDIEITTSGNTLTANLNGISGSATYQWIRDGEEVGTTNTYTVSKATDEVVNVTLIVTVGSTKYSAVVTLK